MRMYRLTVGGFLVILLAVIAGLAYLPYFTQRGQIADDTGRERGCIAGTFTALYERQSVEFRIQRIFLCGDGLLYHFTNTEGFPVYNDNPTKAVE